MTGPPVNPFDAAEQNPQQNPFDTAEGPKPGSNLGTPPLLPVPNRIEDFIRSLVSGAASTGKGVLDFYHQGGKLIRESPLNKVMPAMGPMGQLINMTTDPLFDTGYSDLSNKLGETINELDQGTNTTDLTGKVIHKVGELAGGAMVIPPIFRAGELGGAILLDNGISQRAIAKVATIAAGIGKTPVQKAMINGIVKSLPNQMIAGLGTSGIIDPQSLATIKGAAVAGGLGAVGSLIEGLNAGALVSKGAKIAPEFSSDIDALKNAGSNGIGSSKKVVNWWNTLDPNSKILAQKIAGLENIPMAELNTSESYINKVYSDPEVLKGLRELDEARYTAQVEQQMRAFGKPKTPAQIRDEVRMAPPDMEISINNPVSAIDELPPSVSNTLIGGRGGGIGGKPPSGLVGMPANSPQPPNNPNNLPNYSQNIQNRIATTNQSIGQSIQSLMGSIINGIKKLPDIPNYFRQEVINRTHLLTVVEKETGINGLPARNLPSAAAQLANGTAWRADEFIKGKGGFILDPTTGTPVFSGTPAYQDILRGFSKDQIEAFRRARIAAHVLDERISSQFTPGTTLPRVPGPAMYGAANIDVGIDPNDARLELTNAPKDIIQATTTANKLINEAGDYATNEGRLDRSTLDWWRKLSPSYTSLQRAFESPKPEPTTGLGRINQTVNKYYKEIRGNKDLKINDPIQNDLDYIRTSIAAADRNKVWLNMRDAAVNDPASFTGHMEPAGFATQLTHQRTFAIAQNIQQIAAAQGHNIPTNVALQMAIQFNPDVFDAHSNTKLIYQNGQAEVWKISPDLAKVANALTPVEHTWWLDLLTAPAQGLKLGITKTPLFPVYHLFRDMFQATVNSKFGVTLNANTIKGLVEGIKKGDMYHEFQASGAGGGTLNSTGELNSLTSATDIRSVVPKTPLEAGVSTLLHPIQALSKLYEPLYIAGKLGEYMKARASGVDGAQAALGARNVTPDMANVGASMKYLAGMDAFLNPALQHIDSFYQNVKQNPFGVVAKGFQAITIPTLGLYFLNQNDEQIQEMRRGANGSRYWYIRYAKGNDGVIRLPKPWIPGYIFGTLAEQALDKMKLDNPDSWNQFKDAILTEANFSFIPQVVQIPMSLYGNKDYYSGIPIVPLGLEQVDPQYQTTPTTSTLSKRVSDILLRTTNGRVNISPAQLDYVIRTTTGNVGSDIAAMSGTTYKGISGPSKTLADTPLIGKLFARYPTSGAEDVRKFYAEYDKAATFARTLSNLEQHNPTKIEEYVTRPDVQKWLEISPVYTETYKQIAEINRTIHDIDNLPDDAVSANYKREVTDNLMLQIIQVTKSINNAVYSTTARK